MFPRTRKLTSSDALVPSSVLVTTSKALVTSDILVSTLVGFFCALARGASRTRF